MYVRVLLRVAWRYHMMPVVVRCSLLNIVGCWVSCGAMRRYVTCCKCFQILVLDALLLNYYDCGRVYDVRCNCGSGCGY